MRYLLDTSAWIRAVLDQQTLPPQMRKIIGDPRENLGLCIFSLWEAAKKHQKGKLRLPMELGAWLQNAIAENVEILPLTPEIIVDSTRLPSFQINDPADRLIVATARIHALTLLTSDTELKSYQHAKIRYFTPIIAAAD